MIPLLSIVAVVALPLAASAVGIEAPECKRFDQIYASSRDLANKLWGSAFTYEEDEDKAYTMWFFDRTNPNDELSRSFGHLAGPHDDCNLSYYHKDVPGPEPDAFTECHPWKDNACCAHETVMSGQHLNEAYGEEFHWDRCGPLSQECERFFVQEACFYECDPNAGFYRKWKPDTYDARCDQYAAGYDAAHASAQDCDHNTWQMHRMPIKASYWDAMYDACRKDLFCGDGDYFSCAAKYELVDQEKEQLKADLEKAREEANEEKDDKDDSLDMGLVVLVAVLAILALCMCAFTCFMVQRERNGKPMFGRLG